MALSIDRKKELAGVIRKMNSKGEPKERIQQMVNAFSSKFSTEKTEGIGVKESPADITAQRNIPGPVDKGFKYTTPEEREAFEEKNFMSRTALGAGQKLKEAFVNPFRIDFTQEEEGYQRPPITMPEGAEYGWGALAAGQGMPGLGPKGIEKKQQILEQETMPYEELTRGDFAAGLGEFGADLGTLALPGSRVAKGVRGAQMLAKASPWLRGGAVGMAEGVLGAGLSQLERVGEGRDVDLAGAGLEAGASSLLPLFGGLVGPVLKKIAPGVLRSATKPPLKVRNSRNPPNFETPLEQNLISRFGGLEKAEFNVDEKIGALGEKRAKVIEKAGMKLDLGEVRRRTQAKLTNMAKVESELTVSQKNAALKYSQDMFDTGIGLPSAIKKEAVKKPTSEQIAFGGGKKTAGLKESPETYTISGMDAVKHRQLADKNSGFTSVSPEETKSKALYNEVYRDVIEDILSKQSPEYKRLTKEMAKLIPVAKAMSMRLDQQGNNYKIGLLDWQATTGGAIMGGIPGAVAMGALQKATTTPGGAAMLYQSGKSLSKPSQARDYLRRAAQTGMSAVYNEEQPGLIPLNQGAQ